MGRNKKKRSKQESEENANSEISTSNAQDNSDEESTVNSMKEEDTEVSEKSLKRPHSSDESDTVDVVKPKKAKKKKNPPVADESSKKNKKSKRQIKKEKLAQRLALEQASLQDQNKEQSLNYLSQWKHDKQNWKFKKTKQIWLRKNKFSTHLVPDASWPLLLEYFESVKGNLKNLLLEDANKIIKQMEEWTESQADNGDKEQSESTDIEKPNDTIYNRARSLIQCLEE